MKSYAATAEASTGFHLQNCKKSHWRYLASCVFFSLALLLTPQAAFSENSFCLNSQYLDISFYSNGDLGTEAESDFASISYGNNFSFAGEWNTFSSIRLGDETEEFTAAIDFWPEVLNPENSRFSFGNKLSYHYLDYGRWCIENDILFEPFLKYTGEHDWYLKFSIGFAIKEQKLKVLNQWLDNTSFTADIEFDKKFSESFEAFFIFSTHDEYRYYLFPSPLYTLGVAYTFDNRLRLQASYQLYCCDMFISKVFLDGEQFKCGIRLYL